MNRAITSITTHRMKGCFETWKDVVAVHCIDDCNNDDRAMVRAVGTGVHSRDSRNREIIDTEDMGDTGCTGKGRSPLQHMILSTLSNCPDTVATYSLRTCDPRHPHPHPHITSMIDYTEERLTERVATASMVQRDMLSLPSETQRKGTQRSERKSVEYSTTLHEIISAIATPKQGYEISTFLNLLYHYFNMSHPASLMHHPLHSTPRHLTSLNFTSLHFTTLYLTTLPLFAFIYFRDHINLNTTIDSVGPDIKQTMSATLIQKFVRGKIV